MRQCGWRVTGTALEPIGSNAGIAALRAPIVGRGSDYLTRTTRAMAT